MDAETVAIYEARYPRLVIRSEDAGKFLRGTYTSVIAGPNGAELWLVKKVRISNDGQGCAFHLDRRLK